MAADKKAETQELRERRERSFLEHYKNLTPEQIEKVYSLTKLGYELYFVRVMDLERRLAVLRLDGRLVSVDYLGEVDFDPDIKLRN